MSAKPVHLPRLVVPIFAEQFTNVMWNGPKTVFSAKLPSRVFFSHSNFRLVPNTSRLLSPPSPLSDSAVAGFSVGNANAAEDPSAAHDATAKIATTNGTKRLMTNPVFWCFTNGQTPVHLHHRPTHSANPRCNLLTGAGRCTYTCTSGDAHQGFPSSVTCLINMPSSSGFKQTQARTYSHRTARPHSPTWWRGGVTP